MVIDRLAAKYGITLTDAKRDSFTGTGIIADMRVILAKPRQYMNQSGPPVARLAAKTGLPPDNILIIHDDIDIILGKLKIKTKGGHGGHNGLKSIVAALGTGDFPRIRIGIGRPETPSDVTDHVLGRFSAQEIRLIQPVLARAEEAVETILSKGLIEAMNLFHKAITT